MTMQRKFEIADDETTAFSQRWRPALVAFFTRRVRDRHQAEDLAHDTLLRALNSSNLGEQPDAYVFRIAQNLLIDSTRRRQVRNSFLQSALVEAQLECDALDPERIVQARQQLSRMAEALEVLPERTRSIFILYRLEGLSQDEIGEAFGISASAVKQHVAKAMAALARRIRSGR
jgi:RNA polymerase sigma-70 factor (ECF subfamily)